MAHGTGVKIKGLQEHGKSVCNACLDYQPMQLLSGAEHFGNVVKGIDRSFELRGEIRLIRSVMTNWRLGNFFMSF